MSQIDDSIPVNDPDQLVIAPVSDEKRYLGNAAVVHEFVGHFANDVMRSYDGYLAARVPAAEAQAQIKDLVKEYGGAFMGRDPRYEIAPWQGVKLRQMVMRLLESKYLPDTDCGEQFFNNLALQCVKCCIGLSKGYPEEEVGENLKGMLDYYRGLILGMAV